MMWLSTLFVSVSLFASGGTSSQLPEPSPREDAVQSRESDPEGTATLAFHRRPLECYDNGVC
ncbi:MAG: hypothetical protein ACP5D7_25870 [Limnospira sp.]